MTTTARPFISPAASARIQLARERMWVTRWQLQNPQVTVVIRRPDGTATDPQAVVVQWANREPRRPALGETAVMSQDGSLSAWGDIDAPVGGQFVLQGQTCEVVEGKIVDRGVAHVGFRVTRKRD